MYEVAKCFVVALLDGAKDFKHQLTVSPNAHDLLYLVSFRAFQFIRKRVRIINFAQGLDNSGGID